MALKPEDTLSVGQLKIVELVAEGLRNCEIAERLGRSENTVKGHLTQSMAKTGTESRAKLLLWFQAKFPTPEALRRAYVEACVRSEEARRSSYQKMSVTRRLGR